MSGDYAMTTHRFRPGWLTVSGVLLLTTISMGAPSIAAASGFTSKNAAQIVSTAVKNSAAASSFLVDGTVDQPGSDITVDLSVSASGMSEGTISINGGSFRVIEIDGVGYFNADTKFWTKYASAAAAQLLAGRWVYGPMASSPFSTFKQFLSPRNVISSFLGDPQGPFKKGGTSTVEGQEVVSITGTGSGALYVATTGEHFVVRVQATKGSSNGTISFTHYDLPVRPKKPAGGVNLQQLEKQGSS
jgi:hypothetical protein